MTRQKLLPWGLMLTLAALCLVVFGQGINHELTNLDDNIYITDNPDLERGLSPSGLGWAFTTRLGNLWMPVTWISFLADHQFFGNDPGAYHRTNILLHLLSTLLLFWLIWRTSGGLWRAALVAALFAVHPLHVESVAWVAERKDVLSGFLFLLSLGFYLQYEKRLSWFSYLGSVVFFGLSLMAKPMVVTFPLLLLLMDVRACGSRRPWRRLLLEKVPFLLLSAGMAVATFSLVQTRSMGAPDPTPLLERLGQAVVFYSLYLGKLFYPANLAMLYPAEGLHFAWWQVLMSLLLLLGISALFWRWRIHKRALMLGWLWYLVMLLPVTGIIQGGTQLMSDRYFYLPGLGLFVTVVWGLGVLADRCEGRKLWRRLIQAVSVLAVLVLAVVSFQQTKVWRNSTTLYTHALQVNDNNHVAHMNLGVILDEEGQYPEALVHLKRAAEIKPLAPYLFNLANTLAHMGRHQEAIPIFEDALRLQPVYPTAHNNLGISLATSGRWAEAGKHFQLACDQQSDFAGAFYNLGLVQENSNRLDLAAGSYQRALELEPGHQDARLALQRVQGSLP